MDVQENNRLYFTIKLPRAGGSTLCRRWQQGDVEIRDNKFTDELSPEGISRFNNFPRIVVTPDAWRLALGHRYNWYAEPMVFSNVQIAIRALLMDYDVLVDDTHTTEESIKRIFEIEPTARWVIVDTDYAMCVQRAKACGQGDLEGVINRMSFQIAALDLDDNDDFHYLRQDVVNHSSRKIIV